MAFSFADDDLLGMSDNELFRMDPAIEPDMFGSDSVGGPALPEQELSEAPFSARPREAKAQVNGYVVIARKYRPQTFDQLVGQEAVQQALRGAIANDQISHSYLFSGPRGTGKTSTARILAKAVNCQAGGPRPDPCGKCSSCRSITVGSSLDVIEIDAASNTGVDNIRDLKSGVALAPFSRYKVYIVDEVHMLSNQAFNALLKTLEEPPPNVIFVLATTEIHKVPETIVSRCQSFQFKRFSLLELKTQLGTIFDKEAQQRNIEVETGEREKILELIARSADGGMRDAQVTLDQVLVLSRGKLDFLAVQRFLGMPESEVLDSFMSRLQRNDSQALLSQINELVANGQDLELFVRNLADFTRDLLIVKCCSQGNVLVNVSEDRLSQMRELVRDMPITFLVSVGDSLLKLLEDLKVSNLPRFALELAIIRLANADTSTQLTELKDRLTRLENDETPRGGGGTAASTQQTVKPQNTQSSRENEGPPLKMAQQQDAPYIKSTNESNLGPNHVQNSPLINKADYAPTADQLLDQLQKVTLHKSQFLHSTLCHSVRVKAIEQGVVTFGISDRFGFDQLSRPTAQATLRELLKDILGRDVSPRFELLVDAEPDGNPVYKPSLNGIADSSSTQSQARATPSETNIFNSKDDTYREPVVYFSPEIRAVAVRELSRDEVTTLLSSNVLWRNLIEKAQTVFKLNENSFRFQISTI